MSQTCCHDLGCCRTGLLLGLVPVCKFVPTRCWCLGMVSQSWMSTWMTKLQENILQRENKGISCPCVEHLDLWNREEKPFSILYMIKKDSPSWKAVQIFWCHPLNSEQWVEHSSWVLISTWAQSLAYSAFFFQLRCVTTWKNDNLVVARPNICWQSWNWAVSENQPRKRNRSLNQS